MENPITKVRKALGFSKTELALAAGVDYAAVTRNEAGYARSLHKQLAQFLKEEGYEGNPQAEYAEWLDERRKAVWLLAAHRQKKPGSRCSLGGEGK